ncbi:MAG: phosphotransferase [Deltaproteobacteria bacterium]|nr:phosphotransferase [Deltaproteobacteria bacterium]
MTAARPDWLPALRRAFGESVRVDETRATRMTGDASTRTYWRVGLAGAPVETVVVMQLPDDYLKSDEASSSRPTELPFLNVQRHLAARGVPVVAVLAHDLERRVVVLEDLGDETFFARLERLDAPARRTLYERAVDLLAELHRRTEPAAEGFLAHTRSFDRALLRWELDHFREWGLEALHGPLETAARAEMDAAFDALADRLAAAPTQVAHRDYQSRNLMVRADGSLVVIDFQDALVGPMPYDLVALLCDSYVELDLDLQRHLIARYVAVRQPAALDLAAFEELFWLQALQRKLKDAGRFVYIDRVRRNPSFLQWFPRSIGYVARALEQVAHTEPALHALLPRLVPGWPRPAVPDPTS